MSDKEYAPLTAACVRALSDKMYDKRKAAALEIEKMVRESSYINNTVEIKKLIKVLGENFTISQNTHMRKGGLIGLAAVAIALQKDAAQYIKELVFPILACFNDPDMRVRYFACESLYNVVKVARGAILPHFAEIFSSLSMLAADSDQQVKNGSETLDRLMKDIVTENASFDLANFIPLLRERIYTRNTFTRQFIISWVSVLDAVPEINLIALLPEILDGLFRILEDPTIENKKMCDTVLGQFLHNIKKNPSRVDFQAMINILIVHSQASDELLQGTAITWIKEFVQLAGKEMLPFASGILSATLPCLAYDTDSRRSIKETAKDVNLSLMELVMSESKASNSDGNYCLDLKSVVEVLVKILQHSSVPTKVAVLKWIDCLHQTIPHGMMTHMEELFPVLLQVLSDTADDVVLQDLQVLAAIMSYQHDPNSKSSPDRGDVNKSEKGTSLNPYFSKFVVSLLKKFSTDTRLLENRGSFVIRELCLLLNAEDIYRTLAAILRTEQNLKFTSTMVDTLNTILLTASELFVLRNKLKNLADKESCDLFRELYMSWCHNPVATVSLCLLTQNYKHVCDIIRHFGDLEVTVEFLTEIDRLIQLLESPIFTFIRLELLEVPHNRYLVQALYGLLMLLPQTDAFHTLRHRLDCVPSLHLNYALESSASVWFGETETKQRVNLDEFVNSAASHATDTRPAVKDLNFPELLAHFLSVQELHQKSKREARQEAMLQRRI